MHGLAECDNLHTQIFDRGLDPGLPVPEFHRRVLQNLEAVAERALHPVDPLLNGGLQVGDGCGEGLDLVRDKLQLGDPWRPGLCEIE